MSQTSTPDSASTQGRVGKGRVVRRSNSHFRLLFVALSVVLFSISFPGNRFPWIAWVAMVPLFIVIHGASSKKGFLLIGMFGWLIWLSSVWWLQAPLQDITGMSVVKSAFVVIAGCLLLSLPYAFSGWLISRFPRRPGIRGTGRDAAIFTGAITFLTPVFQGSIAHTQYQYPVVFQILDLGGVPLLLFVMFWFNLLLAEGVVCFRSNRTLAFRVLGSAVALLVVILGYGGFRMEQLMAESMSAPSERWFTVGAIQPNIPITVDAGRQPDPSALSNDFYTALEQAKDLVRTHPELDLIALPENPATFRFNDDTARRGALGKLIRETGKPVLLNADAIDPVPHPSGIAERYNIAVLMDADRNVAGNYAKMKRIPIVEYVPWEASMPWLRKIFPQSQRVLEGRGPEVFPVKPGIQVVPLICYEGTFSRFTGSFVKKGGNIIINLVNDSWFLRTPASEVHLALTLYRTVEYRIPLVRVTNSGVGVHVRADGSIVEGSRTGLYAKSATAFPLHVPMTRSLYSVLGNYWMLGLVLFAVPWARSRKTASSD